MAMAARTEVHSRWPAPGPLPTDAARREQSFSLDRDLPLTERTRLTKCRSRQSRDVTTGRCFALPKIDGLT